MLEQQWEEAVQSDDGYCRLANKLTFHPTPTLQSKFGPPTWAFGIARCRLDVGTRKDGRISTRKAHLMPRVNPEARL